MSSLFHSARLIAWQSKNRRVVAHRKKTGHRCGILKGQPYCRDCGHFREHPQPHSEDTPG